MHRSIATLCFLLVTSFISAQARLDWVTTKDHTGACQISVPKNWGQSVTLVKGSGKVRTFSPETQKMYAQKMLENSAKRVFYVMKSTPTPGAKAYTTYMVSVPGDGFHCTAQLVVQPSYTEDEVKKIVATLAAKTP
ncbi:MAG: hypothetical protein LAP86_23810 [Acidobacteriia bacterium]|nr:hypothetical protein [Terriglobia bacterium]